jgi:hypothetical protein
MSAFSWVIERCPARRSRLFVSRSTRLSQEELVRVKCRTKRGGRAASAGSPASCGRGVVEHQVHLELAGDHAIERGQELLELDRAAAGVQGADHLGSGDVQCRVQDRGARALVVVRRAVRAVGQRRQVRRGNCDPNLRQILDTAVCESPTSAASSASTSASHPRMWTRAYARSPLDVSIVTVRSRLGRGSSTSASRRCSAKRERHLCAVFRSSPSRRAISPFLSPSAAVSTTRERCASARALFLAAPKPPVARASHR